MTRIEVLQQLLEFTRDPADCARDLATFPWDSPPLVVLERRHVHRVLERFLSSDLSAEQVQSWADAIELRDDIDFERGKEELLGETVTLLATPEINEPLTPELARNLQARLAN